MAKSGWAYILELLFWTGIFEIIASHNHYVPKLYYQNFLILNRYLQERLKQMEEEKSIAMATVSKYKVGFKLH